jgi:PAS domain S-box-containing protein
MLNPIKASFPDSALLSTRELNALFDQSPAGLVYTDRELRVRRTNAAFRRLVGQPDEALIGRRPSEIDHGADGTLIERILAEQVLGRDVPVVEVPMPQTQAGERRFLSWSAYRITDNGQVLGVLGAVTDITDRVRSVTALRQANARLDLLERAGSQIGTTLDIHRTAGELAALAVPELADRVAIDLCDQVLQGDDPPCPGPGALRFRRVAVRDATTTATVAFAVGELIAVPLTTAAAAAVWSGKPLLARSWAEMSGQVGYAPGQAGALRARGVHSLIVAPLTARGVTLGVAAFSRAENPEPYDEADQRLASDIVSRAAVHIDNARLYTRERTTAVTLQRSLLPRHIPPVAGLDIAYRYQPASQAAEVGGDWFDVIPLDTGEVALVVGDVTGHGTHAAAIMGQLRTTTAALARLGHPPGQIMTQLSEVVAAQDDEAGATCLYAVYDPASRRCRLTRAGHPPPALRRPDGVVEFLDLPGGMMLGVGQGRYPVTGTVLPAGSVLALYTDGLIEHPGQDLGTGMSRLARALATAGPALTPDQVCDDVLASTTPHARDDVTLVLARTTGPAAGRSGAAIGRRHPAGDHADAGRYPR